MKEKLICRECSTQFGIEYDVTNTAASHKRRFPSHEIEKQEAK